jgi:hypothetical protein
MTKQKTQSKIACNKKPQRAKQEGETHTNQHDTQSERRGILARTVARVSVRAAVITTRAGSGTGGGPTRGTGRRRLKPGQDMLAIRVLLQDVRCIFDGLLHNHTLLRCCHFKHLRWNGTSEASREAVPCNPPRCGQPHLLDHVICKLVLHHLFKWDDASDVPGYHFLNQLFTLLDRATHGNVRGASANTQVSTHQRLTSALQCSKHRSTTLDANLCCDRASMSPNRNATTALTSDARPDDNTCWIT